MLSKIWDRKKKGISTIPSKIDWYVQNGDGSELQLKNIQHHLNQLRAEVDSYLLADTEKDNTITLQRLKLHHQSFLNGDDQRRMDRLLLTEYVA